MTDFSRQSRSPGQVNPCDGVTAPEWVRLEGDATALSILFSGLAIEARQPLPTEVLLASDAVFADALASGPCKPLARCCSTTPTCSNRRPRAPPVLQATTVRILGGEAAISAAVTTALTAEGFTVVRTFGPTRLETAEQIAQLAGPAVDTVLLARAFPAAGGDDTQAFADSLAAGDWAAATGWPVMLSQTEVLSDTTRAYLDASAVTTARIIGGEAALSSAVTDALGGLGIASPRTAGPTRFDTATAIMGAAGFGPASPATVVFLLEGQAPGSWAAGFTAAHVAAVLGAPIVLANGDLLPDATQTFLQQSVAPVEGRFTLLCVTTEAACATARTILGL